MPQGHNPQPPEPSPSEIAAACAEIRKGWSERVHYIRAGRRVPAHCAIDFDEDDGGWTPPVLAMGD